MKNKRPDLGALMKERAKANDKLMADYFRKHPFATGKQCAIDTGLSMATVYRFIKRMRERDK